MEIFRNTNFDFLGKKWPFIIASLVLSVAGLISLAVKGGPRYGIDFQGGTLMTVKFQAPPDEGKIRSILDKALASAPTVQKLTSGENLISIGTEGEDNTALTKNRQIVMDTLEKNYGQPGGKPDFNNSSEAQLFARMSEALPKAGIFMSDADLKTMAAAIMTYRNTPPRSGILTNFNELTNVPKVTSQIAQVLGQEFSLSGFALQGTSFVGPKVGAELRSYALRATLLALAGMLVYIAFRFEWIYGVAAVVAVFHDTLITVGMFSIFDKEISLTVIAALLTLVGYSMNDTIVIFDRIRENLRSSRREKLEDVINRSVNQTLSRTIMTSGLTFLTVMALFLFGGPVLHGFSFALVVGILIGTYSSVFVASPIVLYWHDYMEGRRKAVSAASAKTVSTPVNSKSIAASKPASKSAAGPMNK
jgi:preprotein translocase subunit SecF